MLTTRGLGVGSPWCYDGTYFAALGEGGEVFGEESLSCSPVSGTFFLSDSVARATETLVHCQASSSGKRLCARPPMGEAGRSHGCT